MSKKTGILLDIKYKLNFKRKILDNFSNKEFSDALNKVILNKIKPKIEKGLSPVDGARMFPKYKNPDSYPGDRKQSNKPNLKLTGEMLYNYVAHEGDEPLSATVGIHRKDASPEVMIRAEANNSGTMGDVKQAKRHKKEIYKIKAKGKAIRKARKIARQRLEAAKKGIPARPFVPVDGETFTRDIILEIRKAFAYCLKQAIQRGKNK